jgi:hypothetical protein
MAPAKKQEFFAFFVRLTIKEWFPGQGFFVQCQTNFQRTMN